jgi:hypothetical protein
MRTSVITVPLNNLVSNSAPPRYGSFPLAIAGKAFIFFLAPSHQRKAMQIESKGSEKLEQEDFGGCRGRRRGVVSHGTKVFLNTYCFLCHHSSCCGSSFCFFIAFMNGCGVAVIVVKSAGTV